LHQVSEIDFLKVDVEGFEGHVLRGGKRLIERSGNLSVLCELAEKNFRPLNLSINAVIDWMRERGYEVWEIDQFSRLPIRLEANRKTYENQNFLFVRPKSSGQSHLLKMTSRSKPCSGSSVEPSPDQYLGGADAEGKAPPPLQSRRKMATGG
jgi:hypothetical protein